MDRTEIKKWEMEMCCDSHVESLLKMLQTCKDRGHIKGFYLTPNYAAAPQDETLFDSVRLYAKSVDEGNMIELSGEVTYWNPFSGFVGKTAVIHTFHSIDECVDWLKDHNVSKECAEILFSSC